MIENGTVLQNRYLIEERIGVGGMGAVYRAVDQRFDNHVALKETFYKDEEFGEAFEREARLLNALQHPVLPHVSDYFTENNGYFLVMQYIEGSDLSHILKREGAFPIADVLEWTDSLLDALDYLHSQEPPIIHRDIKPHNLKLNQRGGIMLLDFGLAKVNRPDATEVSVFGYSRTYSPLEQIQGTGTDAPSDIFALGATVYHLLTGTEPTNALTRATAILNGEADPLQLANELRPEIPESVASVIHSALALNAQNRFISAKAMRQALEYAVAAEGAKKSVPEKAPALAVGGTAAPISDAGPEDFPALGNISTEAEKPLAAENLPDAPPAKPENISPRSASRSSSSIIVDIPTKDSGSEEFNQKRLLWAAAAVLLFFGIAAAFYFSNRENSAEQSGQLPVNANASVTNSNRESLADTRKNPKEKSKYDEAKPETEGKVASPSEDAPKRKNQSLKTDETLTDEELAAQPEDDSEDTVEETDAVEKEKPRQAEKPIPDVMTEEELEHLKREEKQKRRTNRNKPDLDDQLK
jgi:serine/threonine protein kinase